MSAPLRESDFSDDPVTRQQQLVSREWLVTAGNGGYACGTLGFVPTRRHHGILVANQPAPQGRTLSLVQLREEFVNDRITSGPIRLWGLETTDKGLEVHGGNHCTRFHLDCGLPVWTYRIGDIRVEKSIVMPYQENCVCIRYVLDGETDGWHLRLRPVIQFRGHNDSVSTSCDAHCEALGSHRYEFTAESFPLSLDVNLQGAPSNFISDPQTDRGCFYRVEHERGYDHLGDLKSPGFIEVLLQDANRVTLMAAMEPNGDTDDADATTVFDVERSRREGLIARVNRINPESRLAELVLAADQFLMTPASRAVDQSDEHPSTPESERKSVIAGYPWFTDWGRDTMIGLPGLTLATNRHREARQILLTFADYVRDGLIPNLFPEGGQVGMYHTADATLWYFQAIAEYEQRSGDQEMVPRLFPKLTEIINAHLEGTLYGIHVDSSDDLLVQGQHDVQLTWMDAKAGSWVVTPRRGKAVEINALWYNALHLYCDWAERYEIPTDSRNETDVVDLRDRLQRAHHSFN